MYLETQFLGIGTTARKAGTDHHLEIEIARLNLIRKNFWKSLEKMP